TITGRAGQAYILQHFDFGQPYFCGGRYWVLTNEGTYWVSTTHSGDPSDSIDATAIITATARDASGELHVAPLAAQVVELARGVTWSRRSNLLDSMSVFVYVRDQGKYEILSRGVDARFRIEPFFVNPPEHYEPPEPQASPSSWDLDAGYYVLTAQPQ